MDISLSRIKLSTIHLRRKVCFYASHELNYLHFTFPGQNIVYFIVGGFCVGSILLNIAFLTGMFPNGIFYMISENEQVSKTFEGKDPRIFKRIGDKIGSINIHENQMTGNGCDGQFCQFGCCCINCCGTFNNT